jgi:L1 cell adhesion molecule like protein
MTRDNNRLGMFELTGIPPAPCGVPKIQVSFDLDANGILNVAAKDEGTGRSNQIRITNEKGRLTQSDIDRMVADAEKYKAQDDNQKEKIATRNNLEQSVLQYKQAADNAGDKLSNSEKVVIILKCDEIMTWLDNNGLAEKDELDHQLKELQKACSPIMARIYR